MVELKRVASVLVSFMLCFSMVPTAAWGAVGDAGATVQGLAAGVLAGDGQSSGENVTVDIGDVDDVLLNPGKGWTVYGAQTGQTVDWEVAEHTDYLDKTGIGYARWEWAEIEPERGEYNWKPIDDAIEDFWNHGKQFAFGIMAANTSSAREYVTPKWVFDAGAVGQSFKNSGYDGTERTQVFPTWTDPVFLECTNEFVEALGERYNGDERIAFIDIRSYGNWGEQHLYGINDTPDDGWKWILENNVTSEQLRELYIKPYIAAFPDTQLVNVWGLKDYNDTYEWAIDQGVSIRRDGIMYHSDGSECAMAAGKLPTVYEYSWYYWHWKHNLYTNKYETDEEWTAWFKGEFTREVNNGQPSYLQLDKVMYRENPEFCDWLANYMGYWFRIKQAAFPRVIGSGEKAQVTMRFANDGVAPNFRPSSCHLALLDASGNVVASCATDWNSFDWKPGTTTREEASVAFDGVESGSYRLAFGMFQDERDEAPSYLFGSEGATEDKWYVLGEVEVRAPEAEEEYSSVSALREASPAVGAEVRTAAYYEDGPEDGGATYVIEASDAGYAEDGGRYLKLANGLWAVLQIKGDAVDVRQFGAYGDDEHDDTDALKAALCSGVKTVRISAGVYRTRSVDVNSESGAADGLTVVGADPSHPEHSELKLVRPVDYYPENTYTLLSFNGIKDLTLKGFWLCGDTRSNYFADSKDHSATSRGGAGRHYDMNHLQLWYCDDVELDGLLIVDTVLDDVNEMLDVNSGVKFIGTSNLNVHDSTFKNLDCGIITQGSATDGTQDCHDITISANSFDGHRFSEPISFYATGPQYVNVTIADNKIFNKQSANGIFIGDGNDELGWPDTGRPANPNEEGYQAYTAYEHVTVTGNTMTDTANCIVLNHVKDAHIAGNASVRGGCLTLSDCEGVTVSGHSAANVAQMGLAMRWRNKDVTVTDLAIDGYGLTPNENGDIVFPALNLTGIVDNVKISGAVKGTNVAPGANVTGSGYDLSGVSFDLPAGTHAVNVYEGASGNVVRTTRDTRIYDGAALGANDFEVDATGDVVIDVNKVGEDASGDNVFGDTRVEGAWAGLRYHTTWHATWKNWASGTGLAFMDAAPDGFVRKLVIEVPAEGYPEGLLRDGDGSEGSIAWLSGGHTIAKGESATFYLVCQGGSWRELDSHVHALERVAKASATCTAKGVKAHWRCTGCGKLFADAAGQRETTLAELAIAKVAHTWGSGKLTVAPTLQKAGKRVYTCSVCKATKSVSVNKLVNIAKAKVTLSSKVYVYNGKARKPAVTVKVGAKKLKSGTDYTLAWRANKNVGKATVTVKGKGLYGGSKAVTFKINPKGTSLSKVVPAKRGFTAKWAKRTAQTSGYQLQFSLKKGFKNSKTAKVAKPKVTSKKVTKLKPKKRYYVRVRTYKKVGKMTYCSTWSKAKSVTTKK